MAVFNPDVPEPQPPSYLNLSKPVENFDLKSVGGTIARGIGEIVSNASAAADTVVKSIIDDAINTGVDTQRDALTGALEARTGVPVGERVGTQPDNVTTNEGGLTSQNTVPGTLQSGLGRAGKINEAKLQNLDADLYYRGRLIDLSRDLRSQWGPGYRPYIDQRIAEMTGGNPANIYVNKLMQTYNEMGKGNLAQDDYKQTLALIRSKADEIPGADEMYKQFQAGNKTSADVVQWVSRGSEGKIKLKGVMEDNGFKNAGRDQRKIAASDAYNNTLDSEFDNSWHNITNLTGFNAQQSSDIADRILAGEEIPGLDSVALKRIGQTLIAAKGNVERTMWTRAREKNSNGESVEDLIGTEAVKIRIAAKTEAYKDLGDKFLSEKAGAAFETATTVDAIIRDKDSQLFRDKTILGRYLTYNTILARRGGLGAEGLMRALSPSIGLKTGEKLPDRIDAYLKSNHLPEILLQPDPQNPKTIKQIMEDAIKKQKEGAITNEEAAKIASVAGKVPQIILNSKVPDWQKLNVITSNFSVPNVGAVDTIKEDRFDEKGNFIPGNHAFFAQNTSKPMIDEVWRVTRGNQGAWESAKIYVEKDQAKLVEKDVLTLNHFTVNPYIKLDYDTTSNRLSVRGDKRPAGPAGADPRGFSFDRDVRNATEIVNKINSTFPALVHIAEKEGRDPNAYIFNQLVGMGLDPSQPGVAKMFAAMRSATKTFDPFNTKKTDKNQDKVPQ